MNQIWRRFRDPIYAIGLGLTTVLVGVVILLLYFYWQGYSTATRIQVLIGALSGLGTLLLAAGTFLSLWQNEREVEELHKDREKPIVADEIQNFIQPAIDRLERDIQDVKYEDRNIDWHNLEDPSERLGERLPRSVIYRSFAEDEVDRTALKRFQEEAPDLWERVQEREKTIERGIELSNSIVEKIRDQVIDYIEENEIENREGEHPEIDTLLHAILKDLDSYADNHADYEVWENYCEEFLNIRREYAGEEYEQLLQTEDEIFELTKELREKLLSRKVALREEYGISSDEVETETDVRQVV